MATFKTNNSIVETTITHAGSTHNRWNPTFGAWKEGNGYRFRVWAPQQERVSLVIYDTEAERVTPMSRFQDGTWGTWVEGILPGTLYRYRLTTGDFPDPASRFQPLGVHGPSMTVTSHEFEWTDASWPGPEPDELIIYELHIGTFSPIGTFQGVQKYLPHLASLGVNAIELMPIADFPGDRNWGYDGVDLFAPARCYGEPDDLRALINAAHECGIAVLLDVVYNHFGPEGNYLPTFSPYWFTEGRQSSWGQAINFDGPYSAMVRRFFLENALYWIHEYHFDGLRLDATHAIEDTSEIPFLSELASVLHMSVKNRRVVVIAEDHRNEERLLRTEGSGGLGLDGVWADDFHHSVRVAFAGDNDGYYEDFTGSVNEIVEILNRGWLYDGRFSKHWNGPRGTDPANVRARQCVHCVQNHDQIGNRALGDRLTEKISPEAYRAVSTLLLMSPGMPLLFMGQEWGAKSPFQYFTDHPEPLGRMVTEGRFREFGAFEDFATESSHRRIPDPQAPSTFEASSLNWDERHTAPHDGILALYQSLISLRGTERAIRSVPGNVFTSWALGENALAICYRDKDGSRLLSMIQLRQAGKYCLPSMGDTNHGDFHQAEMLLSTEDAMFASDALPIEMTMTKEGTAIRFQRPGAICLRLT